MHKINREQAEQLLEELSIVESKVSQTSVQIRVVFKFSDDRLLVYDYDKRTGIKTYLIGDALVMQS